MVPPDGMAGGAELQISDKEDATSMPSETMAVTANKSPPPEKPEGIKLRALVISAFWAIIVLFGLPMWWQTTSIYRARLPLQEMQDWADGKVGGYLFFFRLFMY